MPKPQAFIYKSWPKKEDTPKVAFKDHSKPKVEEKGMLITNLTGCFKCNAKYGKGYTLPPTAGPPVLLPVGFCFESLEHRQATANEGEEVVHRGAEGDQIYHIQQTVATPGTKRRKNGSLYLRRIGCGSAIGLLLVYKKTTQTGIGASSSHPDEDEGSENDESYELFGEDEPFTASMAAFQT
ncbi:hypothetical protein M9H77_13833 [Catharanthus roseus]|uniref:Uncharacterized protein n=1 Tax=Catharanthus roseus TaxID=4058 RepID=A0ACC0BLJ3_CATRO|nr:hypothetical protein M9H77_13833 [Catharanthus roseus]